MSQAHAGHRVFFALWPDPATREQLQVAADAWLTDTRLKGRRIERGRLHLTLYFLGNFACRPQALIDRALAAGNDVHAEPFAMDIDTCGNFGRRVNWLGPRTRPAGLVNLWQRIGQALVAHDIALPEAGREWTPHVTVMRGGSRAAPARNVPVVAWQVRDFVLVHGTSVAAGGYTILRHFPLGTGEAFREA